MVPPTGISDWALAHRRGRGLLYMVFFFSIFTNALMLTGPLFMLQVYDRVLASRSEETLIALFGLVTGLYLLFGILDYARGRLLARYGARLQESLEHDVFRAAVHKSLYIRDRAGPPTGLRDLETLQGGAASPAMLALFDLPWTPLFFAAIFVFHPMLGWAGLIGGGVLICITALNHLLTGAKTAQAQDTSHQAQILADQAAQGADILHSQNMTTPMAVRWLALRQTAQGALVGGSDISGGFAAVTKSFRLFLQSAMLALGAWLALRGEITPGAMIAGTIILGRALAPMEQTLGQWGMVQRIWAARRSVQALLVGMPPVAPQTTLPRPRAHVTAQNLATVPPGAQTPTLRGLTFSVQPGQALGVIGKSGAGKSSLARVLVGLWRPAMGEVRLDQAPYDQYRPDDLGDVLGYLPQDVMLFPGTVAENIARMSTAPDDAAVVAAARAAHAHDMIVNLPKGYDTVIATGGMQLSGGQKQRIALARALYTGPEVLILDEPNAALDNDGALALNGVIRDMKSKGKAVIIMTHRPQAIAEVDTLLVLEGGQMRAFGPRDDVLKTVVQNVDAVLSTAGGGDA
ncbi:MAG: type I secretion system permease/ATPase [Pseudomonadota bacterium]